MRNPLNKRIPRELKKNPGKYLGMLLILICTICVGTAFQTTMDGAIDYLEEIKEGNRQEDGFFETGTVLPDSVMALFSENGVEAAENFYATEYHYAEEAKVFLFQQRTQMDLPTVFSGRLPEKENEIAIDHVFARGRSLAIGDEMELLGRRYEITGTVSLPDYSSLFLNNTDLVMNTSNFCVSVLSDAGFAEIPEQNRTYRYSYRFADRALSKPEQNALAEKLMKDLFLSGAQLRTFLPAEQNQSISFLEMDMGTDGPFMTVFVYLLIALIAFVFAILTNNTIEHESVIIGTLRASGYTRGEIIWHYLQPTLIVAAIGSVVGNALGYTVMIQPLLNMYYTTYSIGPIHTRFAPGAFVLTTVVPVVIMVAINTWMLARKMSLTPLQFLRRELKKNKSRRAAKLPNLSFLSRFRLRIILQNKGSYVMLFTGVFLASFLLMFGIGLEPLMNHYTGSIEQSLPYQYQYILAAPAEAEDAEPVYLYELKTWFALGKKDVGVTCFGIEADSLFFRDALPEQGVTVSSALAAKLGLKPGDKLTLKDGNRDMEFEVEISKVYDYTGALALFLNRETLNELAGVKAGTTNCLLSNRALELDERLVIKQITRQDMMGAAKQMMSSFGTVIQLINVFSVAVYMILMYVLTKVVIDKNALSISYMKVFGYRPKEIRKLYLTATTIVVLLSLIICIPMEVGLFKLVLVYLSSMIEGYMEFYLPAWVYAEIIAIGIVAYLTINALHMRSINRIPMTEALKNRE